ncbi:MAG: ABC transporter permease, partial [Nitrospiria bacterium]
MAYRDLRGGSRHFLPILAGIALGVGAVVGVGAAADTVQRAVSAAARSLMAADVEIASTRELTVSASSAVEVWTGRGVERSRVTELLAMASGPRFSALIELKAVEAGYPFYGRVETIPAVPLAGLLGGGPPYGAVVQDAFLIRSGLRSGDHFTLGSAAFVVTAVLRAEPDRVLGTWSLGPRVLISREALSRTGLIQPGSRVRYRTLLRVPETLAVDVVRRE